MPEENQACEEPPSCDSDAGTTTSIKDLPRLVGQAIRIVWSAARKDLIALIILQVISGVGLGAIVLVGGQAFAGIMKVDADSVQFDTLVPTIVMLVVIVAVLSLANAAAREKEYVLRELTRRYCQDRVLDAACAADLVTFEDPDFHDRLARAEKNGSEAALNMTNGLARLAAAATGIIGVGGALIVIQPLIVPLAFLVFIPAYLVTSKRGEAYYRFARRQTPGDRERVYLSRLLTDREAAAEVRAFELPSFLRKRYDQRWQERLTALYQLVRRHMIYQVFANLAVGIIIGGAVAALIGFALAGQITLGESGAAAGAIVILGTRLVDAGFGVGSLFEASLFVEDFAKTVRSGQEAAAGDSASEPSGEGGFKELHADNLSFTYPSGHRPALQDVSIQMKASEVVALVGENGSGKTTLAKLLSGLYSPSNGSITWDGEAVTPQALNGRREEISVVFQDFQKYQLTAAENIALGKHDEFENQSRIAEAASRAGIASTIDKFPNGYDTLLGPPFEGGTDLSIGQWQRMALARAFFRNAPFIILDEPTAALDARAEYELFVSVLDLLKGRSVLLISHRFSSVRMADRIYVMREGAVVEHGSHAELMALDGYYAELFNLQAAGYQKDVETKIS